MQGPDFPDELFYLYEWACELLGRSGVGIGGLSPLTYTTLRDWAELTGRTLTPQEVEALMLLDAVMCNPDAGEKEKQLPNTTPKEAWPSKKPDAG